MRVAVDDELITTTTASLRYLGSHKYVTSPTDLPHHTSPRRTLLVYVLRSSAFVTEETALDRGRTDRISLTHDLDL